MRIGILVSLTPILVVIGTATAVSGEWTYCKGRSILYRRTNISLGDRYYMEK